MQRVARGGQHALGEIGPGPLDQRHGRGLVRGGFRSDIKAIEFAFGLVASGGGIGHIIRQHLQRLHAGAEAGGSYGG